MGFAGGVCFRVLVARGRLSGLVFGRGLFPYLYSPWVVAGGPPICGRAGGVGVWVVVGGLRMWGAAVGFPALLCYFKSGRDRFFQGKAYECLGP